MDEILQKVIGFIWSQDCQDCQEFFKFLKKKLVEAPILKFPNWSRMFYVHVDAPNVTIGSILAQPYYDTIDQPNSYTNRKINKKKEILEHKKGSIVDDIYITKILTLFIANPFTFFIDH
jgi:hypothetical protein